ncbi:hypothetical protein [Roseomonas sp. BN140053]|uniref:hypothetical protein n=1 Tax=Roseomonas sp. BN140053 TaxID=3391898 RepID=UPI0039EA52E9
MPFADQQPDPATLSEFVALAGRDAWDRRLAELLESSRTRSLGARAVQQRHMLELTLGRLCDPAALAAAGRMERLALGFAAEALRVAAELPTPAREKLRDRLAAGLAGESSLCSLFHLLRVAALQRSRGFAVQFAGLCDGADFDLLIEREGVSAEVACETVSAEEGRHVHRQGWCALVDRVNPELQTWLSAHPGRYVLKMTLPEGLREPAQVAELHRRIAALLATRGRQDAGPDAVLKLDPLLLAGAQATLPASLRAQFGPDAHLAVAGQPGGGSVFVIAAQSGRENDISAAACRRLSLAATARLSGSRPGLLAMFLDDIDRAEWRGLRDRLELEGTVRRFLTRPEAKRVVAVSCASRMELFDVPAPDGVAEGELRFRNPSHPQAKLAALLPAVASSI